MKYVITNSHPETSEKRCFLALDPDLSCGLGKTGVSFFAYFMEDFHLLRVYESEELALNYVDSIFKSFGVIRYIVPLDEATVIMTLQT